ncbi:MAG TPA: phasin family protein, partial [Steroidobacter sp.]|nr:phasin family protein [Steroidobacter sp.]
RIMAGQKKGKRSSAKRATRGSAANVAQQIWLAGLGALARAQSEGPKLFEGLVIEGAAIQERGRKATEKAVRGAVADVRDAVDTRVEAVRSKATEALDSIEQIFQTRVQKALQQIGVPTAHEIQHLSRKVNELTRSVQGLTRGGRSRATSARRPRAIASRAAAPAAQQTPAV